TSFFVYKASDETLFPGSGAAFAYFKRRNSDGSLTNLIGTAPSITDFGDGQYEFLFDTSLLTRDSVIRYLIDLSVSAAVRYLEGEIRWDKHVIERAFVGKSRRIMTSGPFANK